MATQQDIKRRIASVRNTRKITKAMELVAGAKLRRAQTRIEVLRDYADAMLELMVGAARKADARHTPLLQRRDPQRVLLIPLTGDRGLAGGFNSQIVRRALELHRRFSGDGREVLWMVVGKRGTGTLRFRGHRIEESFTGFTDRPDYSDAESIVRDFSQLYTDERVDEVILVYNSFKSALEQYVTDQRVLPIDPGIIGGGVDQPAGGAPVGGRPGALPGPLTEGGAPDVERHGATSQNGARPEADVLYEPEPQAILNELVPTYLETTVYRALLESAASEHGARMTAMRSASENAQDVIASLTLAMNRARQAEITQEILEVVAGADALA
jgi:F-type H+-transporting ATPase subunit gamma